MEEQVFEILGYHKDYWVNGKYAGYVSLTEPDREYMAYRGRVTEILTESVKLNKTTLSAGVQVTHECIPLCGKIKGDTLQDRMNVLKTHYQNAPYKRK